MHKYYLNTLFFNHGSKPVEKISDFFTSNEANFLACPETTLCFTELFVFKLNRFP